MADPYSVLVVTWNCADHLDALVESMNAHLTGAEELLVVDNASSDDPAAAVGRWRGEGRLIKLEENVGFGAANNVGVREAAHDVVVMINPDTRLIDGSLADLASAVARLGGLVGPRMLNPDLSIQPSANGPEVGLWPWVRALVPGALTPKPMLSRTEPYRLERTVRVTWLTGSCIAGSRSILLALGPFDPALHLYGEDTDLGLRAEQAGIPCFFCPRDGRVVHEGAGSSEQVYGSKDGWRPEGMLNSRAALRRAYGARREWLAWRAQRLNLRLRVLGKALLRRDAVRDRAALRAALSARRVPELPPAPAGTVT